MISKNIFKIKRANCLSCKIRIWGDQGQEALETATICLLNCGPTGSGSLKNMFLGGIRSITAVYGSKVELRDLGNNFMGGLDYAKVYSSFSAMLAFYTDFDVYKVILWIGKWQSCICYLSTFRLFLAVCHASSLSYPDTFQINFLGEVF